MNQGDNDSGRVAGSFTFQCQMPNGKSLSFSGYVLAGQTQAEINQHLDVASAVVERQRLAAEIPTLQTKLEQTEKAKEQVAAIVADLTNREKLTSSEKQQLNTMRVNLKSLDDEIQRGEIAIGEARRSLLV
jgi:hypothetical protein